MSRLTKYAAILWLFVLSGFVVLTADYLRTPGHLQFNLLALLPQLHTQDGQHLDWFVHDSGLNEQYIILVGSDDSQKAKDAFLNLQEKLTSLGFIPDTHTKDSDAFKNLIQSLYPYRAGLLSHTDREQLLQGKGQDLFKRALSTLTSPFFGNFDLIGDPFGLFPSYVQSLTPIPPFQFDEEGFPVIQYEGKQWYILRGKTEGSAFSINFQERVNRSLQTLDLPQDIELLKLGALFYAAAGAEQAKKEVSMIGGVSILLIIGILLFVFQSLRPLMFACITIGSGIIGGLGVTFLIFDSVHILSLVFGLSLVGIAVDYAIHSYCAGFTSKTPLTTLIPALPLGMISSVFGYSALTLFPFPGIRQMAVLTSAGLIFAFITVCLWGHYFVPKSKARMVEKLQKGFDIVLPLIQTTRTKLILSSTLVLLFLCGVFLFQTEDNVKAFQTLDANLQLQEATIRNMLRLPHSSSFFIIEGEALDRRNQEEEKLIEKLRQMDIHDIRGFSQLYPSHQRQLSNRNLVATLYKAQAKDLYRLLGVDIVTSSESLGLSAPLLTEEKIKTESIPPLWKGTQGPDFNRLFLTTPQNTAELYNLVSDLENVRYLNPPEIYSNIFKSYREMLSLAIGVVILIIGLVLMVKFSGKGSFKILSPIILSLLGSLGIFSLMGIPISVFTTMGFLLVVCIGVDYALFLYCRKSSHENLTLIANLMAALTTLISFGLLTLSTTMAVHSFGVSVLIGISLCLVTTTVLIGAPNREAV